MGTRIVVVGGVAAGMSAAAKARRADPSLDITVFERTPHVSYGACGLPYYVSGVIASASSLVSYTADYFRTHRNIDVRTLHEATSVDTSARTVTVTDLQTGREYEEPYDRLMLATGSSPLRLQEQEAFDNVYTLHTLADGEALRAASLKAQTMAVIGGGFIAMELCEALRARGVRTLVFQRGDHIMRSLDPDMTVPIEEELAAHGVSLYKGQRDITLAGDGRRVERIETPEDTYPVDGVVVAIGVRPNVSLARKASIRLGPTGAISVSRRMETSAEGVYAGGDNTEGHSIITGDPCYFPLGDTANKMGKVAGENMAGKSAYYGGCMGSAIVKVFDLAVARTGFSEEHADLLGIDTVASVTRQRSRAGYYPGGSPIYTKLIVRADDRTIVGAQMVGKEGVPGRINALATAIAQKMTPAALYHVDMCYSPPYSPVWDPLLIAAQEAAKETRKASRDGSDKAPYLSF